MITGDIKNIAESYSNDADKVRDDQVVVMEAVQPALMITKKVDKTTYKVGDICEYQLVVTQTIKDAIAKNIVIEDQLSRNGAKVIKNSIKIYAPDGQILPDSARSLQEKISMSLRQERIYLMMNP